jgi:hypothetical protein
VGRATINITSAYQWNPPLINRLDPAFGPSTGGTTVAILGTDFHDGVKVTFGTLGAASVVLVSSIEIRAVTPAGTGPVDVKVLNVDGKSVVKTGGFTFEGPKFIRGDTDRDGAAGVTDVILILNYLFRGGTLACLEAADANDDGSVDVSDALKVLLYRYAGRPPPPAPYPAAASDPTPDGLGCASGL